MSMNENESLLINPADLKKRRKTVVDNGGDLTSPEQQETTTTGGKACIEYETMGRFSTPAKMYYNDYSIQDVNDLTLSRQEDLLKNLIIILNRTKIDNPNYDVRNQLVEEFLETMIGMKINFSNVIHEHPWICECQKSLPQDAQQVNTFEFDLRNINYVSIEAADEKLRERFKSGFESMTPAEFKSYVEMKYKDSPIVDVASWTIEKELASVKIKEPISVPGPDGNIYAFRLTRVGDLLDAQKLVNNKYAGKIKAIKSKQYPNIPLAQSKAMKEDELEEIQNQEAKDIVLYARALSLYKVNGRELTSPEEKFNVYKDLPRSILMDFINFTSDLEFGIQDERDMICPHCGETRRRSLQQNLNPFELLPLDINSKGKQRQHPRTNIFIGV